MDDLTGQYKTKSGRIVNVKNGIDVDKNANVSELIANGTLTQFTEEQPGIGGKAAEIASETGNVASMMVAPFTKLAYDYRNKFPGPVSGGLMALGAGLDAASNYALFSPAAPAGAGAKGLGIAANLAAKEAPAAMAAIKGLANFGVNLAKDMGKNIANNTLHKMPIIKNIGSSPYANSALGNKLYEFGKSGANIKELNALKESLTEEIRQITKIPQKQRTSQEILSLEKKNAEMAAVNEALKANPKDMAMTNAGQILSTGLMGGGRYVLREGSGAGMDYAIDFLNKGRNREAPRYATNAMLADILSPDSLNSSNNKIKSLADSTTFQNRGR